MIARAASRLLREYVYRTPSHPGRGLIGKLAHRLNPEPFPAEVEPGVRFYIHLNSTEDVNYWTGRYETQGEVECFRSQLKPGMVVFDVGANNGMYSLAASAAVGPTGRVYGFEAVPEIMTRFRAHVTLNGAANVTLVECAVSDRVGKIRFYPDQSGLGSGAGSLVRPVGPNSIEVDTITLDEFKRQNGIGRVAAVKIDVEGAEHQVLDGMAGILRDDRPVLLIEHNESALVRAGSSAGALFGRVRGLGYEAHLVRRGQLQKVTEIQPPLYNDFEPFSNYLFTPAG
jgi:FkbM family methyltransferase